jgi:KipI family sensor histidine kinase inhibitor
MSEPAAPRVLPAGDGAVLLEFDSAEQVAAAHRALLARAADGVIELVPAARTILVHYDPERFDPDALGLPLQLAEAPEALEAPEAPASTADDASGRLVRLPVVYDGPDLAELSTATGLGVAEIVERHAAAEYVVAFCGFSPGFAYLTGLDPLLRLPRRATPRTRVPAGSVAIADEFAGVYPAPSPGGWHLLGRTDAALWDLERDPPALLAPGTRVRFEPVREASGATGPGERA